MGNPEDVIPAAPFQEVTAVITSRSGTGDGGLLLTQSGQPNLLLIVISPLRIVIVRAIKTLLNTMIGILGIGSTGAAAAMGLPISDFSDLLLKAFYIGLSAAAGSVLLTLAEIFSRLDANAPKLSV